MSQQSRTLVRPTIYQFALGDAVITNVLEGYFHRPDLHPFVATNAEASAVQSLAKQYRIPFPAMEHNFVATIVEIGGKLIVVDPGFGAAAPAPTTGWFMDALGQAGYTADDVDIVLISHCHPDHIGNIASDGVPTFANAQIVIGRAEFEFWKRGENISQMRQPTLALFGKVLLPLEDQLRLIEPEDEIVPGLTAANAFGHSAGHLVFHVESDGRKLVLLNDTTPHYVAAFAHPEWHFSMDDDPVKAAETRRTILAECAASQVPVIGFHLPFPSIGFVETREDGFEFRPATYQFQLRG